MTSTDAADARRWCCAPASRSRISCSRSTAFPRRARRCAPRDLVATTGGCAANAAIAVARLGGRARFSGPVGTDDASRRFLDALAKDRRRYRRACCASTAARSRCRASSSTATARRWWRRCHGERLDGAAPPDPDGAGRRHRRAAGRQPFSGFRAADLPRRARRAAFRVVLDVDKATRRDDPLFATASHVIFSSEALRATTGVADLGAALIGIAARRPRLPRGDQRARTTCCGSSAARCGGCRCSRSRRSTPSAPAIPSTAASRWRWPRARRDRRHAVRRRRGGAQMHPFWRHFGHAAARRGGGACWRRRSA